MTPYGTEASKRFYVYELRDERDVVFYVGKGSGDRVHQHEQRARRDEKSHRANVIRQIWARGGEVAKAIVFETDDETKAFTEEVRLIAFYGRGNLTNKTAGGDGVSNPPPEVREKMAAAKRGRPVSDAARERMRQAKLGKPIPQKTRDKIATFQRGSKHPWASELARKNLAQIHETARGRPLSDEHRRNISAGKMGHKVSEETRQKISETKKGRRK